MDDVERGQETEQMHRGLALVAWRRKAASAPRGAGAPDCVSCGGAIDPRRRAAVPDADRCTECQERWEKHGV